MKGSPGINRLAGVIQERIHACGDHSRPLDFGVIRGDGSLVTNTFPLPIPAADYLICGGDPAAGDGSEEAPAEPKGPQPGDRVLVAWVGNDAVIIGAIRSGSGKEG